MLELVFVIVVIGILAAAIIPRFERDTLYEATEQLQSHIKYTQHLAMTDNVYQDDVPTWFYERWKIDFSNANQYVISKGMSGTSFFDNNDTARDPLTGDDMDGTTIDAYDLNDKYNVTITFPAGETDDVLAFDHLGRPHTLDSTGGEPASSVASIRNTDYVITLTASNGDQATITVTAETGYTFITFL